MIFVYNLLSGITLTKAGSIVENLKKVVRHLLLCFAAKMLVSSVGSKSIPNNDRDKRARPYCDCWHRWTGPVPWKNLSTCTCGEEHDVSEWKWEHPDAAGPSWAVISEDQKDVTFHPFYSSGTAAVRGNTPLLPNNHYYWEVKMLTDTYGTDIMIGLGTKKVNMIDSQFRFTSFLGQDAESYGLSYRGVVHHNATVTSKDTAGFCRGSIIGVRVDMWSGTLEFYLNRKPQGVSFYNLRRHQELFPMVCSTAAQSAMRLTYAASWKASLLVDAAKILAASTKPDQRPKLPPGLCHKLRPHFWLTLSSEGCILDDKKEAEMDVNPTVRMSRNVLSPILPSEYTNGYYVDSVERDYRIVVWE